MSSVSEWSAVEDGNTHLDQFDLEKQINPHSPLNRYTKKIMAAVKAKTDAMQAEIDTLAPMGGVVHIDGDETVGGVKTFEAPIVGDVSVTVPVPAGVTPVPRTLTERFSDVVNVKDFGAAGDGVTDDTAAVQAALDSGSPVFASGTYKVTSLTFPENSKVYGDFELVDGSIALTPAEFLVVVRDGCCIESIKIKMNAGIGFHCGIEVKSNCNIGNIYVYADSIINNQAVVVFGENSHINYIYTNNIFRGILVGKDGTEFTKNIQIGTYATENCLQGVKFQTASYCCIGDGLIKCFPDSFVYPPKSDTEYAGCNGILMGWVDNIFVGNVFIERALEHAVRIGGAGTGSVAPVETFPPHDIHFNNITSSKHGGSVLKINSGYYERAYNIYANNVISIDAGLRDRVITRRMSAVRVSHCDGFYCNSVVSRYLDSSNLNRYIDEDSNPILESDTVEIQNSTNVNISNITADICNRSLICFNEGNDVEAGVSLNCNNINVGSVVCKNETLNNTFYFMQFYNSNMTVNAVLVKNIYVFGEGFGGYLRNVTNANTSNVTLQIYDRYTTGANNNIPGVATAQVFAARSSGVNCLARNEFFDPAHADESTTLRVFGGVDSTAAVGYGSAVTFTRRQSGRTGAAIGVYQPNANNVAVELAFMVNNSTASSSAVYDKWHMSASAFYPTVTNTCSIGTSDNVLSHVYASTGIVETSDYREKNSISDISESLLKACSHINFRQFKFNSAVEKKGKEAARTHIGVVAQDIEKAFRLEGLSASDFGLFCYDEWDEREESVVVIDSPAEVDSDGNVICDEVAHTEKHIVPAGNRYGVRYEELLILECACLRDRLKTAEARIAALEAIINDKQ